jgi:hypothetical protein
MALMAIVSDNRFFLPILVCGLCITIPIVLINLVSDAHFYGYWTVP